MARTKHRKAHKQALAHWKDVHVQAEAIRLANQPRKVAKKVFQVQPDPQDNWREAVIVEVNGEKCEAIIEPGGDTITLTPSNGTLKKGDRVKIDYPAGRRARMSEVHVASTPLRGRSLFLSAIDDMADFSPEQKAMINVDYSELEKRALAQLLEQNPDKTLDELIYGVSAKHPISMGCVVDHACPAQGSGQDLAEHVYGPGAQAHLEMAWHKDENGQPVFDEISICPGPDPNGITTL